MTTTVLLASINPDSLCEVEQGQGPIECPKRGRSTAFRAACQQVAECEDPASIAYGTNRLLERERQRLAS